MSTCGLAIDVGTTRHRADVTDVASQWVPAASLLKNPDPDHPGGLKRWSDALGRADASSPDLRARDF